MRGYVATMLGGAVGLTAAVVTGTYLYEVAAMARWLCDDPHAHTDWSAKPPCGPSDEAIVAWAEDPVVRLVVVVALVALVALCVAVAVRAARAGAARETALIAAIPTSVIPLVSARFGVLREPTVLSEETTVGWLVVWLLVTLATLPVVRRVALEWHERRTRG